jgi:hypothetical protein
MSQGAVGLKRGAIMPVQSTVVAQQDRDGEGRAIYSRPEWVLNTRQIGLQPVHRNSTKTIDAKTIYDDGASPRDSVIANDTGQRAAIVRKARP